MYRIPYYCGHFDLEVEGDRDLVEAKVKELLAYLPAPREIKSSPTERATLAGTTLAEFVNQLNAKSLLDAIVAFAYHLLKAKNVARFSSDDLVRCYEESRRQKMGNFAKDIGRCIERGYLAPLSQERDGKPAWLLTRTGEKYVEAGFKERSIGTQ